MLKNVSPQWGACLSLALLLFSACAQKEDSTDKQADEDPIMSMIYVGEMHYFPETNEFYTSLYLLPELREKPRESIIALFDSMVHKTDVHTRKAISLREATDIFFLNGLDSLLIYDTNHHFVSHGLLRRVECLEDETAKTFIAVYAGEPLRSDAAEEYYCMNLFLKDNFIKDFSSRVVIDPSLDNYILHRLSLPPEPRPHIKNIVVSPGGSTFSVITTREASYLTEVKENQFALLKNMNARYRIGEVLPLPFHVNNKPLLLTSLYIPGTIEKSVSLAVFADFQEYRFLNYNRLSLKKKKPHEREVRFMNNLQ